MSPFLRNRRIRARLLAAAAVGAFLTSCHEEGSGLREARPPTDVVAVVNGHAITRDAFARYAGAAEDAADGASLDAETRRRLLLRMVDEELLFQRGVALGLHRRDPAARRAVLSAVITSATSEDETAEPDDATLRAHHDENAGRFAGPERVAVEIVFVSDRGRLPPEPAPFERVRGEVRIDYLRQRRQRALRETLEALRREADVRVLDRDFVAP